MNVVMTVSGQCAPAVPAVPLLCTCCAPARSTPALCCPRPPSPAALPFCAALRRPAGKTPAELNSPELTKQIDEVMGGVAGQCTQWVNSSAVPAGRRRTLLQQDVKLTSTVFSADPDAVQAAVTAAQQDGSLAAKLKELGVELKSVAYESSTAAAPPAPAPESSDSGLSGGAIAGIVIGSVVVAGAGELAAFRESRGGGCAACPSQLPWWASVSARAPQLTPPFPLHHTPPSLDVQPRAAWCT